MSEENVAHNLCCQIRADDNTSTCTFMTEKSEWDYAIDKSLVCLQKEGRHVRIINKICLS